MMLDPLLFIDMMSKFDQQEKARHEFVPPDVTYENARNGRSASGLVEIEKRLHTLIDEER